MTEKEAKNPAPATLVKQEVIGNKNGMHDIELSKSKDDARKRLDESENDVRSDDYRRLVNCEHEARREDNRFTLGRRASPLKLSKVSKTLNHGGRIGGPVSTPRIVFFRAKKLKEASDAFKGLPFQVFIVGKPHDETSSSSRPFDAVMAFDTTNNQMRLKTI